MKKELNRALPTQSKEPVIERIFRLVERYPSRSAAARAWGINVNTLKNYYRRQDIEPTPRHSQLLKIAEVEGVSIEWLTTGQGESPKSQERTSKAPGTDRLVDMLSFLTDEERRHLTEVLARKGVETVLYLLDEKNIKLLKRGDQEKDRMLAIFEEKKETPEVGDNVAVVGPSSNNKKAG
ncbi:helix-turn-helix domain-containing protein [Serratia marcescens]|uniref:helix-turn-helix domain-containing protein n=1 Tax=Serratia marcescens TaxID=615 RepID=UPI0037D6FA15